MPIVLALIAAALFGAALVSTQFGLRHGDALAGARVSIPAATAMLWLFAPFFFDVPAEIFPAALVFALIGLFFPVAVTLLTFEANRRMGPTIAGTVGSTAPLFAVLAAVLFLNEVAGLQIIGGCALVVIGTAVLCSSAGAPTDGWVRAALWLPLAAAILRAVAQVLSKVGIVMWPNPLAAAVIGYTVSALVVLLLPRFLFPRSASSLSPAGKGWFVLTGLLNSAAVVAMYAALIRGAVSVVAPIVAVYPLFTLALSAAVLRQERLGTRAFAGVALTVIGVAFLLAR
ncbi:MAG TPA: DMT family transporter [Burkholderiales bacterium]|jgi:drug/metabolite transporter (DMT)-like permease|nr:DMT family transporter [Burkholderiales bacterium]